MKRFLNISVLLPTIAGILIGGLLFSIGAFDDAPGICAIGISIGFVLIMIGINKAGFLRKGLFVPIILLCFGAFVALLTTAILLDGEFGNQPWLSVVGFAAAAVLLLAGMLRLRSVRRNGEQS